MSNVKIGRARIGRIASDWGRRGYHRVEKRPGTAGTGTQAKRCFIVLGHGEQPLKMRVLAAQLREHAAETSLETFKRKFEAAAAELERAALDAESRVFRFVRLPEKGNDRGYGR